MKMYLSSYELGNEIETLKRMLPINKRTGYIFNALDFTNSDLGRRKTRIEKNITALEDVGLEVEILDLRDYFGKEYELRKKIEEYGALWISGGNVFILRQAMKLSGLDGLLKELQGQNDFLYGAYSAGACVLSPSLDGYQIVDSANDYPYPELQETLWDGLGIIDYTFLPHYESDHPESADVSRAAEYCQQKGIVYKTVRDGDVLISS